MISKIFSKYLTFILPPPLSPPSRCGDSNLCMIHCVHYWSVWTCSGVTRFYWLDKLSSRLISGPGWPHQTSDDTFIHCHGRQGQARQGCLPPSSPLTSPHLTFSNIKHLQSGPAQAEQLGNIKTKTFCSLSLSLHWIKPLVRSGLAINQSQPLLWLVQPCFYLLVLQPSIRRYY